MEEPEQVTGLTESQLAGSEGKHINEDGSGDTGRDTIEDPLSPGPERPPNPWGSDWSFLVSSSTYKQRSEEFRRLFKELPDFEKLIVDYACALQRDILLQGRLFLSENWICFHSNIFGWETSICLNLRDVTSMTKEKTARLIPNAIQISTENEKFFLTSFAARDRSFLNLFRMWQNVLLDKTLTKKEFWQLVQQSYGSELGLNNDEMENLSLPAEEDGQPRAVGRTSNEDLAERAEKARKGNSAPREGISQTEMDSPSMNFLQMISSQAVTEGDKNGTRSPNLDSERKGSLRASVRPSALALDLNGNENQQAGGSSCSESPDEDDEKLIVDQIEGRLYINRVFLMSAEKMFQTLFTQSQFIQKFLATRKVFDVDFSAWQPDGSGNQTRTGTYTITINNPLIGKFTTATDKQTLLKESREGQSYSVQTEVVTHDVPYNDYFYSMHKYFITRISKHKCRLRICSDLKYRKQPWGLIKTFIERNSWSGLDDYYKQLESDLLAEETLNPSATDPNKSAGLRRRRRNHRRGSGDPLTKHGTRNDLSDLGLYTRDERAGKRRDPGRRNSLIILLMSFFLLLLVLLNLTLFLKLSKIEQAAQTIYQDHLRRDITASLLSITLSPRPYYQGNKGPDFSAGLKGVLQDSITTLEQLKDSLLLLQKSFDLLTKTSGEAAADS
ncbi:protein Aster-C [Spea bombifrons]|uniref:protein Aster-C n=1 Tax=Spea bombifrons TaxID=233779 RepID=UPI002349A7C5|nr:protein Aster-C [Spea bombifrons]